MISSCSFLYPLVVEPFVKKQPYLGGLRGKEGEGSVVSRAAALGSGAGVPTCGNQQTGASRTRSFRRQECRFSGPLLQTQATRNPAGAPRNLHSHQPSRGTWAPGSETCGNSTEGRKPFAEGAGSGPAHPASVLLLLGVGSVSQGCCNKAPHTWGLRNRGSGGPGVRKQGVGRAALLSPKAIGPSPARPLQLQGWPAALGLGPHHPGLSLRRLLAFSLCGLCVLSSSSTDTRLWIPGPPSSRVTSW